ncbi:MAG: SRPBCC domain-containing protein [Pseudomonadota bacterium]
MRPPLGIDHQTVKLEASLNAPPSDVFRAFTDPRIREKWSAPDVTSEVRIEKSDVATGGSEISKCGTRGEELKWHLAVSYHLVEVDKLITFTEELWDGDSLLTVALVTFDLQAAPGGTTDLKVTDQVTSFVGEGGVRGHHDGHKKALENLASLFATDVV